MLISYVNKAVKHMEVINATETDIINANNIKCNANASKSLSRKDETEYAIEVTYRQIDLWRTYPSEFHCSFETKREFVILYFILKALKNKEIAHVKQIGIIDAINNKNKSKLEESIEEFTAWLLIPKSFFSQKLGKDIIRLSHNEGSEIIDLEMERNIILAKLQSYGVSENMTKLRLKISSFDGNYDPYTKKTYLDDFAYYYDDIHNKKDPVKEINKIGE